MFQCFYALLTDAVTRKHKDQGGMQFFGEVQTSIAAACAVCLPQCDSKLLQIHL